MVGAITVLVATVLNPILGLLFGVLAELPIEREELTDTLIVVSVVSGLLSRITLGLRGRQDGTLSGRKARSVDGGLRSDRRDNPGDSTIPFGLIFAKGFAVPPTGLELAANILPPRASGSPVCFCSWSTCSAASSAGNSVSPPGCDAPRVVGVGPCGQRWDEVGSNVGDGN